MTAAIAEQYRLDIASALPGAKLLLLDENGAPVDGDQQSAGLSADFSSDSLLVSYDLFLSSRDNPAIGDNLVALARQCAWVQAGSAGADDPLLQRIRASAKRYCNAAGVHAVPIAQYVFAQLLRWHRRLDLHAAQQRDRQWRPFLVDCELTGKTLGILGYGGIGREVGRLGKAFGMRVLGWRRQAQPCEYADEVHQGPEAFADILRKSQCLVMSLPQDAGTDRIVGEAELRQLPQGAVLINVGRGSTLDEAALVQVLTDEHLAFAAVDTTRVEPLEPDSALWQAPNLSITPHDSAWSPLAAGRLCHLLCENLGRWSRNQPLLNEEQSH